jgi:hypothetical protein
MSKIKDILLEFVSIWGDQNQIYSKQCTIKSVDVDKRICVCTPVDGGADILEVRLEADITIDSESEPVDSDSKGWFVVPAEGSLVIITFTSKTDAFVSAWTEIETIIVKSTNTTYEQDLFTFNDGSFGGLIKIEDLVSRLNEYEDLFTQLKTDFTAWTPVPQDGGLALKTILLSGYLTKTIPSTVKANFENEKVTHG